MAKPRKGDWSLYMPGDAAEVRSLHEAQEKLLGRTMDLPDLMERPVLLALVRRVDGQIDHVVYLEAEAEVCALGNTAIPDEEWDKVADAIIAFLVKRGIRIARAFVPEVLLDVERGLKRRPSPLARVLKRVGLRRDSGMAQYFRWLI